MHSAKACRRRLSRRYTQLLGAMMYKGWIKICNLLRKKKHCRETLAWISSWSSESNRGSGTVLRLGKCRILCTNCAIKHCTFVYIYIHEHQSPHSLTTITFQLGFILKRSLVQSPTLLCWALELRLHTKSEFPSYGLNCVLCNFYLSSHVSPKTFVKLNQLPKLA